MSCRKYGIVPHLAMPCRKNVHRLSAYCEIPMLIVAVPSCSVQDGIVSLYIGILHTAG